jgi:hypothetical protein
MTVGPFRVVAVDPGPTPGVAAVTGGPGPVSVAVFQCDARSVAWLVHTLLTLPARNKRIQYRVVLAVERFVVGPRAARLAGAAAAAQTRDMIGELGALGEELAGVTVVRRAAAEVMPWATDKRLSAAGLLAITKAMPHARAAARHALFTAVRDGGLPDPLSTKVRAP